MKILIIGGTGYISGHLARLMAERGDHLTLFNRGRATPPWSGKVVSLKGDRTVAGELEKAVAGQTFDVVYDMVAYRPEESAEAARIFRGRVGRFIHCSTVSVYMVSDGPRCPITEDQDNLPLMPFWPRNPYGMGYGIKKRACEAVLWKAHDDRELPVTMLRPPYVSGPEDPAKRNDFWIERILDGGPLLVPGTGDCTFQQVYVEDVARAFALLPDVPVSVGKAYNIAGEEIFSLNEYLLTLGKMLDRVPVLRHVGRETFEQQDFSSSPEGDVFTFAMWRPVVFSLDRIRQDLNFRSTPFDTWMGRTLAWWNSGPHGHSNGYARRPAELEFLGRC